MTGQNCKKGDAQSPWYHLLVERHLQHASAYCIPGVSMEETGFAASPRM